MTPRRKSPIRFAAALLLPSSIASAQAPDKIDNIKEAFARFRSCWKPPAASVANPNMDITVIVSFDHDGNILGRPKITYQSEQATDNDQLQYRIAVMEALQR